MWDSSRRRIERKPFLNGSENFVYKDPSLLGRGPTREVMSRLMDVNLNNVSMHSNNYGNSVAEVSYTEDMAGTLLQQLYQNI